jgi:site-specific DNA-methyltransferase (adenine-specific)
MSTELSSLPSEVRSRNLIPGMQLEYSTSLGNFYQADCLDLLRSIRSESVHTFFADPPFNLKKDYGSHGSDDIAEADYLKWCEAWAAEGVRTLAPGGAMFIYNLPKWLMPIGTFLSAQPGMTFKHWVAIDKAHSMPIPNRLSTTHYGMLYYIKGDRPRVFDRDAVRLPIETCRHCGKDVKDYGGHKKFLNPKGLNLSDVWDDIPPVRHKKYKSRQANQLAPVILERVLLLTTKPGDLVCDPFGGAGTTAYVSERLGRRWISGELNDCGPARLRLEEVANGTDRGWRSSRKRIMDHALHACEREPSLFSNASVS